VTELRCEAHGLFVALVRDQASRFVEKESGESFTAVLANEDVDLSCVDVCDLLHNGYGTSLTLVPVAGETHISREFWRVLRDLLDVLAEPCCGPDCACTPSWQYVAKR
jgi:hypothetical protein